MSKVVYLMGAGASYGTRSGNVITSGIPVVNEIPGELSRRAREIALFDWNDHASYRPQDSLFEVDLIEAQNKLAADLTWLAEESAKPKRFFEAPETERARKFLRSFDYETVRK